MKLKNQTELIKSYKSKKIPMTLIYKFFDSKKTEFYKKIMMCLSENTVEIMLYF